MKKVLLILLTLVSVFTFTNTTTEVKADLTYEVGIEWDYANPVTDVWHLILTFDETMRHITLQIPEGYEQWVIDNGSARALVEFIKGGTVIGQEYFEDLFGYNLYAPIDIDILALSPTYLNIDEIHFIVPDVTGTGSGTGTPYIEADTIALGYVEAPSYRQVYFKYNNDNVNNVFLETTYIRVPYNTISANIYMDEIYARYPYKLEEDVTYSTSRVELYNESKVLLDTRFLKDSKPFLDYEVPPTYDIFCFGCGDHTSKDVAYIVIVLDIYYMESFEMIDFINRNFSIEFDYGLLPVTFYAEGEIFHTALGAPGEVPYFLPVAIPGPNGSLVFDVWLDAYGREYDNGALTQYQMTGEAFNFYAKYKYQGGEIDFGVTDPTAGDNIFYTFLLGIGIRDFVSMTIFSSILIVLISAVLYMKGVTLMAIMVIDSVILGFLIYLGVLPTFVTSAVILLLLFGGYKLFTAGGGD